ncbi:BMP family ABC transporter substrate-binding protein [Thermosphaera chiliense]|uniref:BMP family ABC transporter substrate-binding protein n=1 Tax=Thermosphaera chiliense TaxID=3402707 RepID=A0A7M1USE3_9CREN|nr:BMP family ABC transporter substrate-binding protein [Thermosphaera aggregans]
MKAVARTTIILVLIIVAAVAGALIYYYSTQPVAEWKIGIVYDIGGRGDLSFNDMAYLGGNRAAKDFNLKLVEVQSKSESDYLPNLRSLAKSGDYVVIVAVGFLMADAVSQVAEEYPNQLFAIIDAVVDKPNVLSVVFKEHEGSALVGALAAMVAHYYNYSAVGVVLGMEIPVLYKFEAGYYWGIRYGEAKYAERAGVNITPLTILWTYTGRFDDPAGGKTATQAQLAQGAGLVYNVAGATGLGIFEAVEEYCASRGRTQGPPFGIGVDADQDWIKPGFIIASMMKRVDVGVYTAVKRALEYRDGKIQKYGGILELGLAEGGVGVSSVEDLDTFLSIAEQAGKTVNKTDIIAKVQALRNSIPSWIWEEVAKLQNELKTNKNIEVRGVKFSDIEAAIPLDASEIQQIRQALGA